MTHTVDAERRAQPEWGEPLRLVRRARLVDLVRGTGRREAGGVLARDGRLLVVCDNMPSVAVLDPDLALDGPHYEVPLADGLGEGYEDIAGDPATGRLFALIEALPAGPPYFALVEEYDSAYRRIAAKTIDVPLPKQNKGMEGLTAVRRDGELHLLALSERDGRLFVLVETPDRWVPTTEVRLPRGLAFDDYSGVAVVGDRIAVVSQESSLLWLGRLDPATWTVDAGVVHEFPRDDRGRPLFTEVEGVDVLGPDRIVVATDRSKDDTPRAARANEQSVVVFDVP